MNLNLNMKWNMTEREGKGLVREGKGRRGNTTGKSRKDTLEVGHCKMGHSDMNEHLNKNKATLDDFSPTRSLVRT